MTTKELQLTGFARILELLRGTLNKETPVTINREALSDLTMTQKWMVGTTLLMLDKRGFVSKQKRGKGGDTSGSPYLKRDGMDEVTPAQIFGWNEVYNQAIKAKIADQIESDRNHQIYTQTQTRPPLSMPNLSLFADKPIKHTPAPQSFGYYGADGWHWFDTMDEATMNATTEATHIGVEWLDVVQKVAKVINRPVIQYY